MAITAALVKELRELTGAGMMDCKKALTETDGDKDKAVAYLREKGLASATARAGKIASEGLSLAAISKDGVCGAVIEVNSETDFVAKNEDFRSFVEKCVNIVVTSNASDVDNFLKEKYDDSTTVGETLTQKISIIGENLNIRRFEKLQKPASGSLSAYVHGGGKISVIVALECAKESPELVEAGKNVAMQVAAMNPRFISRDEMDQAFIDEERSILMNQAKQDPKNANKPENVVEKIVEGRLTKEFKEFCLVDQEYIKDGDLSVSKYLEGVSKQIGAEIKVSKFLRFAVGEGLQKKEENFAEEVSKAIGK